MSENIFSNFYNKVLSFFQKDRLQDGETAKDAATNRLKLVLMQDRSNLDGATMQKMREQLIAVISRYVEIDQEALDLNLEADGDEIALMLNIPVIRARTREEIEEIEKHEQEALKSAKEDEPEADSEENELDNDVAQEEVNNENKEESFEQDSDEDNCENSEDETSDISEEQEESEENHEEPAEEQTADESPEEDTETKKSRKKNK